MLLRLYNICIVLCAVLSKVFDYKLSGYTLPVKMVIQYGRHEILALQHSGYIISQVIDFNFGDIALDIGHDSCIRRHRRLNRPRGSTAGWRRKLRRIGTVVNIFDRLSIHAVCSDKRPKCLTDISRLSSYHFKRLLNISVWNARSMVSKTGSICDNIIANNTDIFVITESWINSDKATITDADVMSSMQGYTLHHLPRKIRRGGGISLITRDNLKIKKNHSPTVSSFEVMDITVHGNQNADIFHVITIYRPPQSKNNKSTISDFLDEFAALMETVVISSGRLIILGDFNIHVDVEDDPNSIKFAELLDSFNLTQHIRQSTHDKGHTIDLIITRSDDPCVSNFSFDRSLPSDHCAIHFCADSVRPPVTRSLKQHRRLATINVDDLKNHLKLSLDHTELCGDVISLVKYYNDKLESSLDKFAPSRPKLMINKPRPKWFSIAQLEKRRYLRSLERKFLRTGLTVDKEIFTQERLSYKQFIDQQKVDFYKCKIASADNSRAMFKLIDELSGCKRISSNILPDLQYHMIPDAFVNFFVDKIVKIRDNMSDVVPPVNDISITSSTLDRFFVLSHDQVKKIVMGMKNKSCPLDPIPTTFVKSCIDVLVPVLTKLVNCSFEEGVFPDDCKNALVRPVIKKACLDRNILKNYRPVSNCSFLDKLLEKCAFNQFHEYLNSNSLYGKFQSAYRKGHSTETALLKIHNDIMLALDKKIDVILVLLDLSAAFDTIDHQILLNRLRTRFGFDGTVLNWIESFLCGRSQRVCIDGSMVSEAKPLTFGVPQGSILGPMLFSLYVTPLEDIILNHGCNTMIYADDTQIYISCNNLNTVSMLESCVVDIRKWMSANFLAFNDTKTEVVHFSSRFKKDHHNVTVNVGDVGVIPSKVVRNLGVMFDCDASMSNQVSSICKSASFSLYRLGKIRKYVDRVTAEKLVHAFVSSRIDYCNSLLAGLPTYQIKRLQSIQNSAARLIHGAGHKHFLRVTPILCDLHWLPVSFRISFKILCIVFKCIHLADTPTYLKDIISVKQSQRSLRSNASIMLNVPSVKTSKTYGDKAFSINGPCLWNKLPQKIRCIDDFNVFKKRLKTHFFIQFYGE